MKHIIILGDGMSDHRQPILGDKTPLEAANKPHIDALCSLGSSGLFKTVPDSLHPGSEVANLAVLGYDVEQVLEGRGVLEAASMGVTLTNDDLALRCNLICIADEKIKNHSAGHISTEEASELIAMLNKELGSDTVTFYPGVSYRHLLVIKHGQKALACTPPHDVPGTPYKQVMITAKESSSQETAQLLVDLVERSRVLLENHPINIARKAKGKDMANAIWPWSPGFKPKMKTFQELYGKTGAVISAVDLIQGIGVYAGLKVIKVEGATGLYDTNYEGKAKAAIQALKEVDFVYLHIEASDEAGHEGDAVLKTKTIEYLDERVVKYIVEEAAKMDEPVCIAVLPDHPTPCELKTHTREAVPFFIYNPLLPPDMVNGYTEEQAQYGAYGLVKEDEFIKLFFAN